MKKTIIYLFLFFLVFNSCMKQKICYYNFSQKQPNKFKLFINKAKYRAIQRDTNSNFIINVNNEIMYTSTSFSDLSNTKSMYLIRGAKNYQTEEEIEKLHNIKIINNIVGDTITTMEGFMIPIYLEIIFQKLD